MPEGDTIYRAAGTLHRALAGHRVVTFDSVFPALTRLHDAAPLTGRTIERVWSRGKHLLMAFSGGDTLRTHMRMNGSWHIYRPGERWKRARRDMRILVATAEFEAVGFLIPVADFVRTSRLARHRELARLGPDLLGPDFDQAEAVRRLLALPDLAIGDALLNQHALAGIGNVYKSELLFICRVNPFERVGHFDAPRIGELVETARTLLLANVTTRLAPMTTYTGYRRTTRRDAPDGRLWVYGRAGKPCRRCGTVIRLRQSTEARLTYWCPACQGHAPEKDLACPR